MVESQIVILAVAGSSPVGHPTFPKRFSHARFRGRASNPATPLRWILPIAARALTPPADAFDRTRRELIQARSDLGQFVELRSVPNWSLQRRSIMLMCDARFTTGSIG